MQTEETTALLKPAAASPGAADQKLNVVLRRPIGSVDPSDDASLICGWAWNENAPKRPTRLLIQVDGEPVAFVAPQDFRPDLVAAGIGHGCFAFSWRLPDVYRDGKQHEVRVIHTEFNRELPGSPRTVVLPEREAAPNTDRFASPFVNPEFSIWPNGVQGHAASNLAEIAPGIVVAAEEKCGAPGFMLTEPRLQNGRTSAIYGVRIAFDEAGGWWLHHRLTAQPHRELLRGVSFSIELSLGEAEEAVAQRPCEIWLTRQTKDGFEKVRRLVRGRVFRRPTLLTYTLQLSSEEQKLASAKALYVGVTVERCRSLRVYPSQVVRAYEPPADGFCAFEDTRLDKAFEACRELARLNGKAELFATLLPPLSDRQGEAQEDVCSPLPQPALSPATQYPYTQIIVPVYNGDSVIMDCLQSVRRETTTPFQVLIINDGSRKHTTSMLRELTAADPRFLILDRKINKGYTKSINEAVKLASADWVVVLNSDTVVSHGWLAKLHDAAASRSDVGMVGPLSNAASYQSIPRVKDPNGAWSKNDFLEAVHVPLVQARLEEVSERAYPALPLLNGFCTLIRREIFDRCGLYDEDAFPIGYGEETDLCIRAGKAGYALLVADDCFVYHRKSVTFGTKGRKPLTRAGSLELMNKHAGVNISALEQIMQDNPVLSRLRTALSDLEERIR
ncbi:MAG: glycosyltransferase family 2 protein [Bryobacteraceae bacterium]|nr:glycosyltransferase family 2 protein [Bryobacteraceae bacterium]